jgi:hypothetical protein
MSPLSDSCVSSAKVVRWLGGAGILFSSLVWALPPGPPLPAGKPSKETCESIKVVDEDALDLSVPSPDGLSMVCIKEDRETRDKAYRYTSVYLWRSGHIQTLQRYKDLGPGTSVLWSVDSRAFAWNFTYGGASSGWTMAAFDFKSGRLREIDRYASIEFHRRLRRACKKDETDDNSYLVRWSGKHSLLIALEAHPGGLDCREPTPTDIYEVAIPGGRIIRRLRGAERAAAEHELYTR